MSETDPLIERNDDDEGDDEEEANPFRPDSSSIPGPSREDIPLTTMNREREKEPITAETSFIEVSPVLTSNRRAWEALQGIFPDAKPTEIDVFYSKKGRLQVKMFGQGKTAYDLYTVQRGTKVERLNPNLPKQIREALGTEREVLIAAKEKDIEELQKSIREDQIIVEDENEDQRVRDKARERMADKQGQIDALENEREDLEERLPLRERVKNILKKYGFMVTAVVLAVGTTIGVIVNSLTKGLKSVATGIGNGLQTLGKKIAQILTAGSVISFLGKNAWLLILGVAVFMVERFQKNR